ncbi:MAG TPA: DUF2339 domain-containing protein, partial [Gemmatimonadaceae bacterium]|nr:DUF2339 domain-containing protein [Gemmatimonadaceae bacterium]
QAAAEASSSPVSPSETLPASPEPQTFPAARAPDQTPWTPPTPPVPAPDAPLLHEPRPVNRQWAAPLGSAGAPPRPTPEPVAAVRPSGADYSGSIAGGAPPPLPPGLRGPSASPPPPPGAPRPRPRPAGDDKPSMTLETFIGKYFMLGGAVLLLLTGIGYLIAWSIANQMLTPAGRVGLGALAGIAFVVGGFYARRKGEKRWGGIMLSIALAITHTVAWGAGPKLHIVEPRLALGIAALASILLAALALNDEDETLYVVGVGGALLAPFVTQSGRGSAPFTLLYGWIVITAGLFAMRGQRWRTATTVMSIAGMLYAGVGIAATVSGSTSAMFIDRTSPAFFALACTWSAAILGADEYRHSLARSYLITMVLAVFSAAAQLAGKNVPDLPPIALAGTVSAYLILRPTSENVEKWVLDAVVLPLAFLGGALLSAGGIDAPNGVAITLLWGAAAGGAALLNDTERRGPHYMVFGLTTWACIAYLLRGDDFGLGLGMIAHAVVMILLMRKERSEHVALPAVVSMVSALVQAAQLLGTQPTYVATPFLNPGAIVLLLGLLTWWRFFEAVAELAGTKEDPDPRWIQISRTFLAIALFLWGWRELGHTISRDVATSLVTIYFAVVGVGAIHFGRLREVPVSRHAGLGLCVVAAWMAVARASRVEAIGIKVGTFVLA